MNSAIMMARALLSCKMLLVLAKSYSVCWTLELESSDPWPEEVDGVRGNKILQGTGENCQGFHFPDLGFMTVSCQKLLPPSALTLSPASPTFAGLTSRNLLFPLAPSALLKYNNQTCLIKWLADFMSKVEGVAMGDPVLVTEHLTIQFLSVREAMKFYILFKVKQVSVKGERRQHLYMQACLYFARVPVYVIALHFQVIDLKSRLPGLMLSSVGVFD